jgi:hypothetical protein
MKPVRFKATYLGGHPSRQKEKKNVSVVVDGEGVRLVDGFREIFKEPWARITTIAAEGREDIRRRPTLTRWALVGPGALLWKKKITDEFFVVVEGAFGAFVLQVRAKSKYALQAQLAPWAQRQGAPAVQPPSEVTHVNERLSELRELADLRERGEVTAEEYDQEKSRITSD